MDAPSSSYWEPDRPFSWFLERSLAAIELEMPEVYRLLSGCLDGRSVRLSIGDELLWVGGSSGRVRLSSTGSNSVVEFATDRGTLLDLVTTRHSFLDALLEERIRLRGGVDDLLSFHDALQIYLRGAVRCPSLPALLSQFERESIDKRA
jgi:hypothetical protein